MIYSFEETLSIFLRIYGYLQINATKKMPCSVKMEKPRHKTVVFSFIEKLPPDSGVDFIWEFLLFQFYFYSTQVHERRPLPGWFIGKEALKLSTKKWFPFTKHQLEKAQHTFNRYGLWTLLFAWVPVIGDPLTAAAGILKVPLRWFLPLVTLGKGGRYMVIWLVFHAVEKLN